MEPDAVHRLAVLVEDILAAVNPSALFFFHKELELSSFDRTHAQVIGS
jgi:ABC-type Mn2+/Zn2+ transport system permease subunit